ncbi:MAG: hypothetical protein ACOC1D_02365 [Prolixibacteraceae bacterium]
MLQGAAHRNLSCRRGSFSLCELKEERSGGMDESVDRNPPVPGDVPAFETGRVSNRVI